MLSHWPHGRPCRHSGRTGRVDAIGQRFQFDLIGKERALGVFGRLAEASVSPGRLDEFFRVGRRFRWSVGCPAASKAEEHRSQPAQTQPSHVHGAFSRNMIESFTLAERVVWDNFACSSRHLRSRTIATRPGWSRVNSLAARRTATLELLWHCFATLAIVPPAPYGEQIFVSPASFGVRARKGFCSGTCW